MKLRTFVFYNILGLALSALIVYLLINRPIALILISVVLFPYAFIYTQVHTEKIELGVFLTYFSTIIFGLVTMWVYQFFKWPPTIMKVLILNVQVLVTFEFLYTLTHYFLNRHELKNYMQFEVFLLKYLQLLIAILAPLAAYQHITYQTAIIISVILLFIIYQKIMAEIKYMYVE